MLELYYLTMRGLNNHNFTHSTSSALEYGARRTGTKLNLHISFADHTRLLSHHHQGL
jgi:hypothetical protein